MDLRLCNYAMGEPYLFNFCDLIRSNDEHTGCSVSIETTLFLLKLFFKTSMNLF